MPLFRSLCSHVARRGQEERFSAYNSDAANGPKEISIYCPQARRLPPPCSPPPPLRGSCLNVCCWCVELKGRKNVGSGKELMGGCQCSAWKEAGGGRAGVDEGGVRSWQNPVVSISDLDYNLVGEGKCLALNLQASIHPHSPTPTRFPRSDDPCAVLLSFG